MFQSPDGDSVVSHYVRRWIYRPGVATPFQSPDGDSVVSHCASIRPWMETSDPRFSPLTGIPWFPTRVVLPRAPRWHQRFQSPDGDSVVSHSLEGQLVSLPSGAICFSPLTGIPWFPTESINSCSWNQEQKFQSPDGDSVVSHRVSYPTTANPCKAVSVP